MAISDTIAYIADGSVGVRVLDVQNVTAPRQLMTLTIPGTPTDVFFDGTYLYVAYSTAASGQSGGGLVVFDAAVAAQPVFVSQVDLGARPLQVTVVNQRAYIALGAAGIDIIDVTNPAQPHRLATYDTPGSATELAVSADIVYVADGTSGLQILRVVTEE